MDYVLITGDQAMFEPGFTGAAVTVRPGEITGTGGATYSQRQSCVKGDENSVIVTPCAYATPIFPIPGTGTITIEQLNPDQIALKSYTTKRLLLLKGSLFIAKFTVITPATNPVDADTIESYLGAGWFVTTNQIWRAT